MAGYAPKSKRDTRLEELTNAFKANPTMEAAQALKDYANSDEYKGDQYRLEMPDDLSYTSAYDPATMSIGGDLQKKLDAIKLNTQGLDKYRQEALRNGPSAWGQMATQQARASALQNRSSASAQSQSAAADAASRLAQGGGVGSGARERLARGANKNSIMAMQEASRAGDANVLNVGMQDEQNRMNMLGQLPGMEVQSLQPEIQKTQMWQGGRQFDIGNQFQENQNKNNFNLGMWQKKMEQWGAGQTAAAQAENAGSWLCTEAAKRGGVSDNNRRSLGKLLRYGMKHHKDETRFYLRDCSELVPSMNKLDADWSLNTEFVQIVCRLVDAGDLEAAYTFYRRHVIALFELYWPKGLDFSRRRIA